jgi:hypothetical protein
VLGATITLSPSGGNVLVAFLALYVSWAGSHIWGIFCYLFHQLRSNPSKQNDGLHYQHQAVFRNSQSPATAVVQLLQLAYAWKGGTPRAIRRNLLLVLLPAAHIAGFSAAAILSSRVASSDSSEALVKSTACGWPADHFIKQFGARGPEDLGNADAFFLAAHEAYRGAASYVQGCYGDEFAPSYSSVCAKYVQRRLVSTKDMAASCPFPEGACMTQAVALDSGYVDSDIQLGITAKPETVSRCAK